MRQNRLIHHNSENRCADHKLIFSFSCPVFTTVVHCLACPLYVIGFPLVITLLKANFTILKIFYKGTKRQLYNIFNISLKVAYIVNIYLFMAVKTMS